MKTKQIAILSLCALALMACKKNYDCTCSAADGTHVVTYNYTNMNDASATSACAADQTLAQQDNNDPEITCSIN